jgi:hypothetical protein
MQHACVSLGAVTLSLTLPCPQEEVIDGLGWGQVEAFPTPAYWLYQVLARRVHATTIRNRLGATLPEEVGACLLGGYGIPADIGMIAFEHLRVKGAFRGDPHDEATLLGWLSEPMRHGDRRVRYRFAGQKARYLASALNPLATEPVPTSSGRALRDWLTQVSGIGPKTASWVARNWLDSDDVAILDIHLLRAGVLTGFFDPDLTVERDYLELEQQFLAFCNAIGVRASELDAVIWTEMRGSPSSVALGISLLPDGHFKQRHAFKRLEPRRGDADTRQPALIG